MGVVVPPEHILPQRLVLCPSGSSCQPLLELKRLLALGLDPPAGISDIGAKRPVCMGPNTVTHDEGFSVLRFSMLSSDLPMTCSGFPGSILCRR